jgi:hypothetical protein
MLFENYTYMETSLELAKVIFGKMHSQWNTYISTYVLCYFSHSFVLMFIRCKYKSIVGNVTALL